MHISHVLAAFLMVSTSAAASAAENLTIPQVQGRGHTSPYRDKLVRFEGVVTQLRDKTFFAQDTAGDGDDLTSDGILVRREPLDLAVGDVVRVEGFVEEQGGLGEFTTTTIAKSIYTKIGTGALPPAIVLGASGRRPPTEAVALPGEDFNPARSGADFFETIEGMLVTVAEPVVVGPTGEKSNAFFVVADKGSHATGMNSLGGITSTPGDFNPERIRVQVGKPFAPANFQVSTGDRFSSLTGAVITDAGAYGIQLNAAVGYVPKTWQFTSIGSEPATDVLTVASYNVENLDAKVEVLAKVPTKEDRDDDVGAGRFAAIADHLVRLMGSPDVVALQEVQDNDGGEFSDEVDATGTLTTLVQAITAAGGPAYVPVCLNPVDDAEGGQPGGNIRLAYLFNPQRVTADPLAALRIDDPAFARTRLPLVLPLKFRGTELLIINVHFSSKSGSDSLYGINQPPRDGTLAVRIGQARAVREYIRGLSHDPRRTILVVGDFNTFWYEEPILLLTGGVPAMRNLALDHSPVDRVSYTFEGNSQSLDHALVLLGEGQSATMKTLHVNSVLPESKQVSDHDPKYLQIKFD
ncbi:endonuclease/exonuclease/phosphatase family protein [Bradyrhizobium sp. BRP14]|nr:endonuclease/exonuclease/phosphatase family protein [Bradyrhizobium sp. BRP14]